MNNIYQLFIFKCFLIGLLQNLLNVLFGLLHIDLKYHKCMKLFIFSIFYKLFYIL